MLRWPWKAIAIRPDGPDRENGPLLVYRVDRDPAERNALASSDGVPVELVAAVERLVGAFDQLKRDRDPDATPLSETTVEGLRALGYVK